MKILIWIRFDASQERGTGDALKADLVAQVGKFGSSKSSSQSGWHP